MGAEYREKGFTLIEVIVSLSLLAVMSVMAYQALTVVLDANERSRDSAKQQQRLHRAWKIIGRDLLHMRARPFSDGLGKIEKPYETDPSEFGLRFSRGGGPLLEANPSGVSRVYYTINTDQQLQRTSWAITASPRIIEGTTTILIDEIEEVIAEHLSSEGIYTRDWPPINAEQETTLPRMIKITILLTNGLTTSRLFPGVVSE